MLTEPYSIYAVSRPLRVAFLIGQTNGLAAFDTVTEYCRWKWGGRFSPLVVTDGQTIDANSWELLRQIDADVIVSLVPIDAALLDRLYADLSPLEVAQTDPGNIRLSNEPVPIEPSDRTIAEVARDWGPLKSSLVLFDIADTAPAVVRDFVTRNFGVVPTGANMPFHVRQALSVGAIQSYRIGDVSSLNDVLLDLGEFHQRVVFPSQICTIPGFAREIAYSPFAERFGVVVGDHLDDLIYFWNRIFAVSAWLRSQFTQLWLPSSLASDATLRPGLTKFLKRFVGSTGNPNAHGADFVSLSQTDADVQAVVSDLGSQLFYPRSGRRLVSQPTPEFRADVTTFAPPADGELHRAHATEEHVAVAPPRVDDTSLRERYWFVDLYVQLRPERFRNYVGATYWWRFPRRNAALLSMRFVNRPSRVRANGCVAALVTDRSSFSQNRDGLIVQIPEDRGVAYWLLCGPKFDQYPGRESPSRFVDLAPSDKGRYLRGVLELFPDLLNAGALFRERYWRALFRRMTNQATEPDAPQRIQLVQTLVKRNLDDFCDLTKAEPRAEWLAGRTLNLARELARLTEKELVLDDFLEAGRQETEAYNQSNPTNTFEFVEDDVRNRISDLLDAGVLLLGIKPKCPRCGYRIWYPIDRVRQKIGCEGCSFHFTPFSEQRWYYKLNSLVAAATLHHGTIPLLLVLEQLMSDARTSFLFIPPTELYTVEGGDKPAAELDLVCLRDGEFILGEVKTSTDLFSRRHFDDAIQVAMETRPDRLLFSALEGDQTSVIRKGIETARAKLGSLSVRVEWYPLREWIYRASPVR